MNKQEHQAPRQQAEEVNAGVVLPRRIHLVPLDYIDGYAVRPGFYEINGATAIPGDRKSVV